MSICEISTTEISPMQTEQRRLTRTVFSCKRACPTCEIPPASRRGHSAPHQPAHSWQAGSPFGNVG
jgi:hypothetical protein